MDETRIAYPGGKSTLNIFLVTVSRPPASHILNGMEEFDVKGLRDQVKIERRMP